MTRRYGLLCAAVIVLAGVPAAASADAPVPLATAQPLAFPPATFPTPSPSPSAAAAPSSAPDAHAAASPRAGRLSFALTANTSYTNGQFTGPGVAPPEAPAFIAGSPLAPGTPYDFFSGAPTVGGYGLTESIVVTPTFALSSQYDVSLNAGFGAVDGNANVVAYWGDQPIPALNPHLGARAYDASIAFPTSNRANEINAERTSIISGAIGRHDGTLALRAGWFDLAQGESFVFSQAPQTNVPINFTAQQAESIGDGPSTFDVLNPLTARLPVQGLDLFAKLGDRTSVELTDALLPSVPETPARLMTASVETRAGAFALGGQLAQVNVAGDDVLTSTSFGGNLAYAPYPGSVSVLPTSTLASQSMTIGGVRADVPLGARTDAEARIGSSCFGAHGAAMPGPCTHGQYYYARVQHAARAFDMSLEALRFEPTYAPAILPYGTPENVWSWSPSWPGEWLKGDYQLVDNSEIGANRQGLRAAARATVDGIEMRFAYAAYEQVRKYDDTTARISGFVEGFFLPQTGSGGTLGHEQHAAATFIAHPSIADVEVDLTDVTISRPPQAGVPGDATALDVPAATLNLSRALDSHVIVNAGAARYAVDGAFETGGIPNSDLAQRVIFAGLQYQLSTNASWALQYRMYSTTGAPTLPSPYRDPTTGLLLQPASPAYHGPQWMFEQRFRT